MIQSRFLGLAFGALMILGFEASASATPMAAASSVVGLSASSGHVVQVTVGMERRGRAAMSDKSIATSGVESVTPIAPSGVQSGMVTIKV
jgi:hypothetical protein